MLPIGAAHVLFILAAIPTGIYAIIYFAERLLLHKKRVARKFKLIQRITQQLFLHGCGILLPLALQVFLSFALGIWVK